MLTASSGPKTLIKPLPRLHKKLNLKLSSINSTTLSLTKTPSSLAEDRLLDHSRVMEKKIRNIFSSHII